MKATVQLISGSSVVLLNIGDDEIEKIDRAMHGLLPDIKVEFAALEPGGPTSKRVIAGRAIIGYEVTADET